MSDSTKSQDDSGLAGKVAIVTGGGAAGDGIGNGRAAAILLARAGTRVLVVDREIELAERTVAMIAEEGGDAAAFAADISEEAQAEAMVSDAVRRFGRLDFLDNNVASTRAAACSRRIQRPGAGSCRSMWRRCTWPRVTRSPR
jgi:NAD(P)-dependent dehydrogenase (short-subunit alcohol dehydrogenase family)